MVLDLSAYQLVPRRVLDKNPLLAAAIESAIRLEAVESDEAIWNALYPICTPPKSAGVPADGC
jgi:Flp pilus assembly CpaF family ATPase